MTTTPSLQQCNFCEKNLQQVTQLVAGNEVYICNECILLCYSVIQSDSSKQIPEKDLIPSKIKTLLDDYVVGQTHAKRVLSVAVYNHMKRINNPTIDGVEIDKSNILLIGGSGSGKTYSIQTIAKILNVPLAIVDATSLTESGYVGLDVEDAIAKLYQAADCDIPKTEKGIVYIDEIDKKGRKNENTSVTRDVSGEGVQQALLKMIEGCDVKINPQGGRKNPQGEFITINTKNILFIVGGAFEGLNKIIEARIAVNSSGIGFGASIKNDDIEKSNYDMIKNVKGEDLIKFGIIPELIGRLPIIVTFEDLDTDALIKILTEPKNALIKQYQKMFSLDDVELEFNHDSLIEIATLAQKRKTGARGLRSIIEDVLLDSQFELPNMAKQGVKKICITKETIENMSGPLKIYGKQFGEVS